MTDLFGQVPEHAMTPAERRRFLKQHGRAKKRGHYGTPGSGPTGETCGSCAHYTRIVHYAKPYLKCGKARAAWTHGGASDVKAGDPACFAWAERRPPPGGS